MAVLTAEEVRIHLSSPPWTEDQTQAVTNVIAQREADLAARLRVPITPEERTETVPILSSGLVATTAPIYQLYSVDGAVVTGDLPPTGYVWRTRRYLALSAATGLSSRPFSLLTSECPLPRVTVHYLAGWGAEPTIVGAIRDRVEAYAINKHSDTVMTKQLDAEAPKQLRETWSDADLLALSTFRHPLAV